MNTKTENELIALARDRDMEAVEALWMQRIEADPPHLEELFEAARYLVSRNLQEQAGLLLWSLVMSVVERGDPLQADTLGRAPPGTDSSRLQSPRNRGR